LKVIKALDLDKNSKELLERWKNLLSSLQLEYSNFKKGAKQSTSKVKVVKPNTLE